MFGDVGTVPVVVIAVDRRMACDITSCFKRHSIDGNVCTFKVKMSNFSCSDAI
jgi:hypothetical protein